MVRASQEANQLCGKREATKERRSLRLRGHRFHLDCVGDSAAHSWGWSILRWGSLHELF